MCDGRPAFAGDPGDPGRGVARKPVLSLPRAARPSRGHHDRVAYPTPDIGGREHLVGTSRQDTLPQPVARDARHQRRTTGAATWSRAGASWEPLNLMGVQHGNERPTSIGSRGTKARSSGRSPRSRSKTAQASIAGQTAGVVVPAKRRDALLMRSLVLHASSSLPVPACAESGISCSVPKFYRTDWLVEGDAPPSHVGQVLPVPNGSILDVHLARITKPISRAQSTRLQGTRGPVAAQPGGPRARAPRARSTRARAESR
jgi:hypothetical protein